MHCRTAVVEVDRISVDAPPPLHARDTDNRLPGSAWQYDDAASPAVTTGGMECIGSVMLILT